jgi:peptidyl-prolyl cis-trans isomerase D
MFDFVRTHNRLFQFLLVLFIFPSFVFVGVQGYSSFTDASNVTVATVNGQAIKQNELDVAHRQQIDNLRQRMPQADIKLFDTPAMKRQTLDALVRERVLMGAMVKDHQFVSDARLKRLFSTDPNYAALRNPDGSVNKDFLSARGMSSEQFAEQLRQDYAMQGVLGGVTQSELAPATVTKTALDALLDRREVQVQRFEAKSYVAALKPTDADIDAYYKAHTEQFRSPEQARIDYVVLDLAALAAQVRVTDEELQKYYNENISRYTSQEERRASHILIAVDKAAPAADRAKAKALAESLLAQVRKDPGSFAKLAKQHSNDPGSADKGGDLDFFVRGAMVKPFEDAAFAMKVGEISNVVESDFGFHIIELTAVRGGERKPFESVKADITAEVSKQLAQKRYAEAAEQFSNLTYEQPDSLQPVVDKLKLSVQQATVGRTPAPGATGPLASTKLLEAVFSSDALKNKRNTQAVETAPNQMVSARVADYQPEQVRPLNDVRAEVLKAVLMEQAAAAARKDGEARVAAVKATPTENLGDAIAVSRTQSQGLPRQVVDAVLKANIAQGPAVVGVDLGNQGYVALKVLGSVKRDAADPDAQQARPYITRALGAAETAAFFEGLKHRMKVDIKASAPSAQEVAASAVKP